MGLLMALLFYLLLLFSLPAISTAQSIVTTTTSTSPFTSITCNSTEQDLITKAFASVSGLHTSKLFDAAAANCSNNDTTEIRLPSRNLTGTVSWMLLRNVSSLKAIDLSGNSLHGSIPTGFWSSPSLIELNLASNRLGGAVRFEGSSSPLQKLNLSTNRFTKSFRLSGFADLRVLDLSRNVLRALPLGIENMTRLEHLDLSGCNLTGDMRPISGLSSMKYLDVSHNFMNGSFPKDFPPIAGLRCLNISFNNFSGKVEVVQYKRFGSSAFESSGVVLIPPPSTNNSSQPKHGPSPLPKHKPVTQVKGRRKKSMGRPAVLGIAFGGAAVVVMVISLVGYCIHRKRKKERKRKQWTIPIPGTWKAGRSSGPVAYDTEAAWVAEAGGSGSVAPVVIFEKPLMELTFSDLAAATSGFGRESQLAEGRRTGPVYRAVLPGDMHVAIKVLEKARDVEEVAAKAAFHELAGLKHPNLLPLLGYCVAGKEKLLLYEYMENGDLNRWLHELPLAAARPDVDDWTTDASIARTEPWWSTRYRIALGIARGLAFLHHAAGTRPVVHGLVDSSNVLLDDDFEPRVTGFGTGEGGGATEPAGGTEADVYGYGVVLMELLTGRVGSDETVVWVRGLVKGGKASTGLDPRIRIEVDRSDSEEREMGEALRVAYLCTAESAEKRPTMRQVVGLLKDIRPFTV